MAGTPAGPVVDAQTLVAQQREAFDAAWQRLRAQYPRQANTLRRRVAESAARARRREEARSEYVRDRWLVRTFALATGELTGLGDDVFYLTLEEVLDADHITEAQRLVRRVAVADHVQDYAIRLVLATHPQGEYAVEITNKYIRFGSSPRGVQAIILAAKVRAMLDERYHISFSDIKESCLPALRHRILLNFEAQAEGISNDDILQEILKETPTSAETMSTK